MDSKIRRMLIREGRFLMLWVWVCVVGFGEVFYQKIYDSDLSVCFVVVLVVLD